MQVTYLNVVQDHEDVLPGVVCREDAHGTAHLAARRSSLVAAGSRQTVSHLYGPYRRTVIACCCLSGRFTGRVYLALAWNKISKDKTEISGERKNKILIRTNKCDEMGRKMLTTSVAGGLRLGLLGLLLSRWGRDRVSCGGFLLIDGRIFLACW